MSPAAEALLRQLMELPAEEREAVVNALRASLEGTNWALQEPDLQASYGTATETIETRDQPTPAEEAELNRRLAAARSGEVTLRSSEEVLDELRRKHTERTSHKGIIA